LATLRLICSKDDQVQSVSAIVSGGTSATAYAGPAAVYCTSVYEFKGPESPVVIVAEQAGRGQAPPPPGTAGAGTVS
jgi:hypothetical protein